MLKNIASTTIVRIIIVILSFLVVIINSKFLGKIGVGTISLFTLGVTFFIMANGLVGGGGLVFLLSRTSLSRLIFPSYIWAFFIFVISWFLISYVNLFPDSYENHGIVVSFIFSLATINQTLLLGKEKIKAYNLVSFLQIIVLLISIFFSYKILNQKEILNYIIGLYIAYSINFILSFLYILPFLKKVKFIEIYQSGLQLFRYGVYSQLANVAQLLNYRLSYYILDHYCGRANLGEYSVGVQLSEALWIVGKSISTIQYARISSSTKKEYNRLITLRFIKFSFGITAVLLIALLLTPTFVFNWIFGNDFQNIKLAILSLSLGTLALSASITFSPYFSGTGKIYHNTIASFIGLGFTLILGFFLIPKLGIVGAGLTSSLSYLVCTIYQMIIFLRTTPTKLKELLPNKKDMYFIQYQTRKLLNK